MTHTCWLQIKQVYKINDNDLEPKRLEQGLPTSARVYLPMTGRRVSDYGDYLPTCDWQRVFQKRLQASNLQGEVAHHI
jgi:hypothetical protein